MRRCESHILYLVSQMRTNAPFTWLVLPSLVCLFPRLSTWKEIVIKQTKEGASQKKEGCPKPATTAYERDREPR